MKDAIYNKQVIVDNLELLKNWKLVEKVKSTDNKQFILEQHISMLRETLFNNNIYNDANMEFKV